MELDEVNLKPTYKVLWGIPEFSNSILGNPILSSTSLSVWHEWWSAWWLKWVGGGLGGGLLRVKVNKLSSTKTQLPYSHYSLPYCRPYQIVDSVENLGEVLQGNRIENSPYTFKMREPHMCNVVCRLTFNATTTKEFKEKIDDEYRVNMVLDNLPLVVPLRRPDQESSLVYLHGFLIGLKGQYAGNNDEKHFIHNHLTFVVKYHKDPVTETSKIVGFEVKPFSIKHEYEGEFDENTHLSTCDSHAKKIVSGSEPPQEVEDKKEIIFTYDVEFQESDVKWASHWDSYLLMADDQIHWTLKWVNGRSNSCVFGLSWYPFAKVKQFRSRDQLRFFKMQ